LEQTKDLDSLHNNESGVFHMFEQDRLLENLIQNRNNNFNAIRFICASLVIYSHAYPLTGHAEETNFLYKIMNGFFSLGSLSVAIFFIISGIFITKSYCESKSNLLYVKARLLRIFPALILLVLLTIFILGPLVSSLGYHTYFHDKNTYLYLKNIYLSINYTLPGVFYDNPYPVAVNGSLWSIPTEFRCYIGVLIVGMLKFFNDKKKVAFIFLMGILAVYIYPLLFHKFKDFLITDRKMFIYFSFGMMIYIFRKYIYINFLFFLLSVIMLLLCFQFAQNQVFITLFLTYIVVFVATNPKLKFLSFTRRNDYSYGIYLYAFPIQQTITYIFNGIISQFLNFIIAGMVTFSMAFLSWHLVEKKCISLKNKSIKQIFSKQNETDVSTVNN